MGHAYKSLSPNDDTVYHTSPVAIQLGCMGGWNWGLPRFQQYRYRGDQFSAGGKSASTRGRRDAAKPASDVW